MDSPDRHALEIRVGNGFDVHAFADGRKLWLGGCLIPHSRGLAGHSDADVLLHVIIDAVLGALAKGDIGHHFPDIDPSYKDIASEKMFRLVWQEAQADGWRLGNCDSVVMAQEPRLAQHVPAMCERIAQLFLADVTQVNVKATTTERLGFVGRKEGIAASAVVLLQRGFAPTLSGGKTN